MNSENFCFCPRINKKGKTFPAASPRIKKRGGGIKQEKVPTLKWGTQNARLKSEVFTVKTPDTRKESFKNSLYFVNEVSRLDHTLYIVLHNIHRSPSIFLHKKTLEVAYKRCKFRKGWPLSEILILSSFLEFHRYLGARN